MILVLIGWRLAKHEIGENIPERGKQGSGMTERVHHASQADTFDRQSMVY